MHELAAAHDRRSGSQQQEARALRTVRGCATPHESHSLVIPHLIANTPVRRLSGAIAAAHGAEADNDLTHSCCAAPTPPKGRDSTANMACLACRDATDDPLPERDLHTPKHRFITDSIIIPETQIEDACNAMVSYLRATVCAL